MPNVTYPLDLTGTNPANFIQGEIHTVSESHFRDYYFIVPNFAPFYVDDFSMTITVNGITRTLQEDVDFSFALQYVTGTRVTGKVMYGAVTLHNLELNGVLSLNYRTIGGDQIADRLLILTTLADKAYNPRTTIWDILTNVPNALPPTPHYQDYDQFYGQEELVQALGQIRDAIISNSSLTQQEIQNFLQTYNSDLATSYVKKSGDSMQGPLTLVSDPTEPLHAATKQYVDALQFSGQSIDTSLYLKKSGDSMQGPLTLVSDPTEPLHAATKQYVDLKVDSIYILQTGDIIAKPQITAPSGFLRCNGQVVSKTTYPDLYNAIGDQFNCGGIIGSGKPWKEQYYINSTQNGDIDGWYVSSTLPEGIYDLNTIVTKNRVYILGGITENDYTSSIYTAPINSDGTLGTWSQSGNLPLEISSSETVVIKNKVYLFGGHNSNGLLSDIFMAPINTDGTLGTWTNVGNLPQELVGSKAIVTKNRVYLFSRDDYVAYTSTINSDGTLGSWSTINVPFKLSDAIVVKNKVYALINSDYGLYLYSCFIKNDGTLSEWRKFYHMDYLLNYSHKLELTIVTKNCIYLFLNSSYYTNNISISIIPIDSNGRLGNLIPGSSLQETIERFEVIITQNKIHILGGYNYYNISASSNIYTATISGGLNDYSYYYNDNIPVLNTSTEFTLPDISEADINGIYHYIKY